MTEEAQPPTPTLAAVDETVRKALQEEIAKAVTAAMAQAPPPKAADFSKMLPELMADPKVQALQAASSKGSSVILEHVQALEENLAKTWEVMKHLRNLALITAPDSKKAEIEAEKKRFNEAYGKLAKPQ